MLIIINIRIIIDIQSEGGRDKMFLFNFPSTQMAPEVAALPPPLGREVQLERERERREREGGREEGREGGGE